jgi:hypothetical protein
MSNTETALNVLQGGLLLLDQLAGYNLDIQRLIALRAQAKAEGRDINATELQTLADEANTALHELDDALKSRGA